MRKSLLALPLAFFVGCDDGSMGSPDAAAPGHDAAATSPDAGAPMDAAVTHPDATEPQMDAAIAGDPGALVTVSITSTVGVLLEDFPVAERSRLATAIAANPEAWWKERVRQQLRLTALRLVYRSDYYDEAEHRRALPMPPESVWTISVSTPVRSVVDGHDLVTAQYTMESAILTDVDSPGISDPGLADVGGVWDEEFVFPVDPTLLLQRTGYACMDEDEFPPNSVDAENAYEFYDDTCDVETAEKHFCHYHELPDSSCVDTVTATIGHVSTSIHFERVAWDETLAGRVRVGEITTPNAPDLKVITEGFQSLSNNRVVYRYIEPDDCSVVEHCVSGSGWRRLLMFDSIDHNVGGKVLDIGPVDYAIEGLGSELIDHHVYELSACHNHYHFQYYGDFTFGTGGGEQVHKNGFCIESTGRLSNNELARTFTDHTCHDQGVDPGWVDLYAAGLTCNWIDVTDVDTSSAAVTGPLTFHSNPDGFICEGELLKDSHGLQRWEPTSFHAADGSVVDRPMCEQAPGSESNDTGTVTVTLPRQGGMVSTPCTDSQLLGPRRNCDFTLQPGPALNCVQTATVTLSCTGGVAAKPQVVRVCERSEQLGAVDCTFQDALATVAVVGPGTQTVQFTCPSGRDKSEPGGSYAVFIAPVFAADGAAPVTCAPTATAR